MPALLQMVLAIHDFVAKALRIEDLGVPAIIPPRKNAQIWKGHSSHIQTRNEAVRAWPVIIWVIWGGYHIKSLVKTKMHSLKRLGKRVISRSLDRQTVELRIRVAILNRYSGMVRPSTVVQTPMP